MRKVKLTMKEEFKYQVIKKLVEENGNKLSAAIKLNLSIRSISRWIKRYKEEGKSAFSHKNKGRVPSTKIDEKIKEKVLSLYFEIYYNTNLTHFSELLEKYHDINISSETIRLWLLDENQCSVKARKTTRRRLIKKLKCLKQEVNSSKKKHTLENRIKELEYPEILPRRPRKA